MKDFIRRNVQMLWLVIFYLVIIIIFSSKTTRFATISNSINILDSASVLGIIAMGQLFTIIAGGIDLSVSGIAPLSAVIFVKLANNGLSGIEAGAVAILVGLAVGAVNGFLVSRLSVMPMIATLATLSVTGGLAYIVTDGTTLLLNDISIAWLSARSMGIPRHAILFVILALITLVILKFTTYGRALYAVGGSQEAGRLAGIRVTAMLNSVYIISGVLAGLAGIILASQMMAGSATLGSTLNMDSVTAVVLGGGSLTGGAGSVLGSVIGVLILGTLTNGMSVMQIQTFYQEVVTGIILLIAVNFDNILSIPSRLQALKNHAKKRK